MANLKLVSPWVDYYRKLEALFGEDPAIRLVFIDETNTIKMFVEGTRKADALTKLLPAEKVFGNVTVKTEIIPANSDEDPYFAALKDAFDGSPVIARMESIDDQLTGKNDYVVFTREVVQYFNDDISDLYGERSTLYQEIAKEVFEPDTPNVHFCTASMPRTRYKSYYSGND